MAVVRDGVVGITGCSSDLLPLTNPAFTAASFDNSNFEDGLPVSHKRTTKVT